MTICPCKGCEPPRRAVGCHGTCEHYVAWQREYDALKAEEKKVKINEMANCGYVVSAIKNMKKKR